jgi:hypothetical protein
VVFSGNCRQLLHWQPLRVEIHVCGGRAAGAAGGFIRNNVREPVCWAAKLEDLGEQWKMNHPFLALFSPRYRRRTILNSIYLIVSLACLWAGSVYVPAAMTYIAARTGHTAMQVARLASYSTALLGVATALGALIVPFVAEWLGRRATLCNFLRQPEQYATECRASAFASITNVGRFAAAGFTFLVGAGIRHFQTMGTPIAFTALAFVVGISLLPFAEETKGKPLPA